MTKEISNSFLQKVDEFASEIQESKHLPDSYFYEQDQDGDLYLLLAQKKVKNFIYRGNFIGRLEGAAFDSIESWFKQNQKGAAVWISPQDPVYYPDSSKIIISEIGFHENGHKYLLNRAIVLDFKAEESLKLAQDLSSYSLNRPHLASINEVRSNALFFHSSWMNILQEHLDLPEVWEMIRTGEDIKSREIALKDAEDIYPALLDKRLRVSDLISNGLLGGYGGSCPVGMGNKTAFEMFFGHSILEKSKKKWCNRCGVEVLCTKNCHQCGGPLTEKNDYLTPMAA